MRPRKEIEDDFLKHNKTDSHLTLEVLLDVRDLLARAKRQSAVLSDA
jgi:hypothetical protein